MDFAPTWVAISIAETFPQCDGLRGARHFATTASKFGRPWAFRRTTGRFAFGKNATTKGLRGD